jgi:hypothetical protein
MKEEDKNIKNSPGFGCIIDQGQRNNMFDQEQRNRSFKDENGN